MITLQRIKITEFRGIRELEVDLKSKTFAVWGPNGSGKSGIVDAIDFALTGSISRLKGSGSGSLTLGRHGPHVHSRGRASDAEVSLTVVSTASGKEATLTRNVSTPKEYLLDPDITEVRMAIDEAARHPEFTLSRRDIIKFVTAEAGARSREVQALLKLDNLGQARSTLKTVFNRTLSEHTAIEGQLGIARGRLAQHLELSELAAERVCEKINSRRRDLGLEAFETIQRETVVNSGVGIAESVPFNKATAIADISSFLTLFGEFQTNGLPGQEPLRAALDTGELPGVFAALQQKIFWETGLGLVEDENCPLCDHEWSDRHSLEEHIRDKVKQEESAERLRAKLIRESSLIRSSLTRLSAGIEAIGSLARKMEFGDLVSTTLQWSSSITVVGSQLDSFETMVDLKDDLATSALMRVPDGVVDEIVKLQRSIEQLPDQSVRAAAVSFLHIAQERLDSSREAAAREVFARRARDAGKAAYNAYVDAYEEQLSKLYRTVEEEFSSYYRAINGDDEATFRASLRPDAGKLEMEVDFYGVGMFPPLAYHSEGHQDGMGVCLYLALMKHLLKDSFKLAVLDDVVMSVDSNHRRQFCRLLKEEFADVQFIITTHDEYWAMQMQNAGLISKGTQVRFFSWTVDGGPVVEQADFWDRIEADLAQGNVPAAAATLRRNLEGQTAALAASIGAKVFYKPGGSYDLGEFLSGVRGRHSDLIKKARKSANSWGNKSKIEEVELLDKQRLAAEAAVSPEGWAVNRLVHFNEWANPTAEDFRTVVDAYKKFLAQFRCSNIECGSWLYVMPSRESPEILTCSCQEILINLKEKK